MTIAATDRAALEAAIVKAIADGVTDLQEGEWEDHEWVHLFVDFEIAEDGERSSSISFSLARRPGQAVRSMPFRMPWEAKRQLAELADGMGAQPQGRWSTVQIRIAPTGTYVMDYRYDPPYRLGGNLLDNRFRDYEAAWLASDEGAPYRPKAASWGARIGRWFER